MSVKKLLTEADKLLERGKVAEAIVKLKVVWQADPLNQIVATKLANAYVRAEQSFEAVKVYTSLARSLSDAGKGQIAIAIFKQALELAPDDMSLRLRFAQECESAGKLSDASFQGQIVLGYFLHRKKYFEAANVMPILARTQPKDDQIKIAWMEILQFCQAEQKLVHLIVLLAGPPGIVSSEFPVGGDPAALSAPVYEALKRMVAFFPRDPKIAYAAAWCAYRRGRAQELYHFLRECLRREPDFSLGFLLFSRALAEEKRLNEALFLYRLSRDRMPADRSADMVTLNRLLEAFVEKNGWIKFMEDSDELLDAPAFLRSISGSEAPRATKTGNIPAAEPAPDKPAEKGAAFSVENTGRTPPPAEIELGGSPSPVEGGMEVLLGNGQAEGAQAVVVGGPAPVAQMAATTPRPPWQPPPSLPHFDPLAEAVAEEPPAAMGREERTEMYSPIEVLQAAQVMKNIGLAGVKTRILDSGGPAPPGAAEPLESGNTKWRSVTAEGEATIAFSPVDAVQAGVESRRPFSPGAGQPAFPPQTPEREGDATMVVIAAPEPAAAEVAMGVGVSVPAPMDVDGPVFVPLPGEAESAGKPEPEGEGVDLGEDLLDGPTRIFTRPTGNDKTEHLLRDIQSELKSKAGVQLSADILMRKAERYTAKRNYYLARKALRHAQAMGADEESVKGKLREIRRLEFPEGLYNAISSDGPGKPTDVSEMLDRLEEELDLADSGDEGATELEALIGERIEAIVTENDPRTVIDFGVGLHEMGLFRQAEALFMRLVEGYPDHAFDAYYLAAVSKLSRRDYAGAVSILRHLSADSGRTDLEKIQVYYALGEALEKLRQPDRSREFFRKVAELDANYRNVRHKLDE